MSKIHAIDGRMFGHALCEEPTGDSTTYERDVTCGDCLDLVEAADYDLLYRMRQHGWVPLTIPSWFRIRPPKLVAVSYTAIYDDGTVTVGAATHDGSERPFEVEFRNARGSSTPTL